jgi:hypothetical protein
MATIIRSGLKEVTASPSVAMADSETVASGVRVVLLEFEEAATLSLIGVIEAMGLDANVVAVAADVCAVDVDIVASGERWMAVFL